MGLTVDCNSSIWDIFLEVLRDSPNFYKYIELVPSKLLTMPCVSRPIFLVNVFTHTDRCFGPLINFYYYMACLCLCQWWNLTSSLSTHDTKYTVPVGTPTGGVCGDDWKNFLCGRPRLHEIFLANVSVLYCMMVGYYGPVWSPPLVVYIFLPKIQLMGLEVLVWQTTLVWMLGPAW